MSRLIDADALMDVINNIPSSMSVCLSIDECKGMKYMKEKAYMAVFQAPTIDAVPVVRCKDCDNWSTEFSSGRKSLGNYRCLCQEWSDAEDHRFTYTGENEYCSRGELREG